MNITIDPDKCQGHARCWEICPEVFELDDNGNGYVANPDFGPELESKVLEAVSNCPERAITAS